MRTVFVGLWLALFVAGGVYADESTPESAAQEPSAQQQPEEPATEAQSIDAQATAEEAADADIREIEQGVSGAEKVKEFIPDKPLSADKAISLPSDI